jgi:hypothetical protein
MGILRTFDLSHYIGFDAYVETGTGPGNTLFKAYPNFKQCYSVDMDSQWIESGRHNFPNAIFENSLSTVALEKWLREDLSTVDKVVFFLDAHFPGSDYHGQPYDVHAPNAVPLEEELNLIKKYRPNSKDIIICDDARIYMIGPFQHGNVEDLQVPGGLDFVYNIFPNAHIMLNYTEEGYIIIVQ